MLKLLGRIADALESIAANLARIEESHAAVIYRGEAINVYTKEG